MTAFDFAVVGAGAVGASCALHLVRAGKRVILLDGATPAAGSSGACSGLVALSTKKPGVVFDLARASVEMYPSIVASLPFDVEYRKSDSLFLIDDDLDIAPFHEMALRAEQEGLSPEYYNETQTLELEPNLAKGLGGSLRFPAEHVVNPYLMTLGMVTAARALGAATLWRSQVEGVEVAEGRIRSLRAGGRTIEADQFVFAAGATSSNLGKMMDLNLPVVPRRGEVALTVRGKPLVRHYIMSGRSIAVKNDPTLAQRSSDALVRMGGGFGLHANSDGQHFIGVTRDYQGYARNNSSAGLQAIFSSATKYMPELKNIPILRTFCGLRPSTPDNKPIIGRVDRFQNLMIATGHDGDGISLSVATGRVIADIATHKNPIVDVSGLSPDRFS